MAVPSHERHGEQIEEAAHVPLDAVVRAAVLAGAMVDRQLRDPVAAVVREHGDVAVELAVELHPFHDLGPVGLEPAVHVVEPDAGDPARDGVEDLRRDPPRERVAPLRLPAGDEVVPLVELGEEPRDLGRIVLQVAVDRHDDVAGGLAEAGVERGRLAEVPAQPDDADVVVSVVQPGQGAEGAVGRAVVDEDRLPRPPVAGEGRGQLVVEERDAALLVVDRDDDRDHAARVPRAAGVACRREPAAACRRRPGRGPGPRRGPAAERVPLEEAAGRILAAAVASTVDLPPFPSSSMDGYAVRAADVPGTLRVVGAVAAGRPETRALAAGEAIEISTGGVVPDGRRHGRSHRADRRARRARSRSPRPSSRETTSGAAVATCCAGDTILAAGESLTPARLGGARRVRDREHHVPQGSPRRHRRHGHRAPSARRGRSSRVRSTSRTASCSPQPSPQAGAVVERLGATEDNEDALAAALERALEADVVVTSGGVSVGPHDLVRRVEARLGVEEVFWGVAMRPGKPLAFGVRGRTLVFGLPGNPVSSLVGALLFVRPALLALQGHPDPAPPFRPGTLAGEIRPPARAGRLRPRAGHVERRRGAARPDRGPGVAHDRPHDGGRRDRAHPAGDGAAPAGRESRLPGAVGPVRRPTADRCARSWACAARPARSVPPRARRAALRPRPRRAAREPSSTG